MVVLERRRTPAYLLRCFDTRIRASYANNPREPATRRTARPVNRSGNVTITETNNGSLRGSGTNAVDKTSAQYFKRAVQLSAVSLSTFI
jgi:hypothetical protein